VVKIEAVVRAHLLDTLLASLVALGTGGGTLSEVRGWGHETHREQYRGAAFEVNLHARLKVELVVRDHLVDRVMDVLYRDAHTGRIGDGVIATIPVEDVVRIRTGIRGDFALL
jgi:nitrogen regulatory protein P-II 1